jgi:tight adherence protein C
MTLFILLGGCLGLGVVLIATSFLQSPVPLGRALQQLHTPVTTATPGSSSWRVRRLGESWQSTSLAKRLLLGSDANLRICQITPAEHLSQRVTFALVGLLWAPTTVALMTLGGVAVPLVIPLWVSLALVPLGFLYPSVSLVSLARARRRSFRHAFSSFLDLVSISLSGGKGIDGALHDGAEAGDGWAFEQIRDSLRRSRLLGETPWTGLARLGDELNVPELKELAASAELGGAEGARVRTSIAAKARALRLRGLTDVEAAAQSASEKMSLPIVGLMVGFIVFLGYPAVIQVVNGL